MAKICYAGKKVRIIKGDLKGKEGLYLGTSGYTGAGVICKILIENKAYEFLWSYFEFINPDIQDAWDSDDELTELDFDE